MSTKAARRRAIRQSINHQRRAYGSRYVGAPRLLVVHQRMMTQRELRREPPCVRLRDGVTTYRIRKARWAKRSDLANLLDAVGRDGAAYVEALIECIDEGCYPSQMTEDRDAVEAIRRADVYGALRVVDLRRNLSADCPF